MVMGTVDSNVAKWLISAAKVEIGDDFAFAMSSPDRLPAEEMAELWSLLDSYDDGALGARIGLHSSSQMLSRRVIMFRAAQEETFGKALLAVSGAWRTISSQSEFGYERLPNEDAMRVGLIHAIVGAGPVLAQSTLQLVRVGLDEISSCQKYLKRVELRLPVHSEHRDELEALFGVECFGGCPTDALVYANDAFDLPVTWVPPADIEEVAEVVIEDVDGEDGPTVSQEVAKEVQHFLPTTPNIEQIASAMGIHPRSLQRELDKEGTSFRKVCTNARLDVARACLRTNATVMEAALTSGYQNASAFGRAYKKRFGKTPSDDQPK